jgi:hypothetical protein
MPKRKLTEEQRQQVREMIKKDLSAGVAKSNILSALSQAFGFTREAARWYFNTVTGPSTETERSSSEPRSRTSRKRRRSRKIRDSGPRNARQTGRSLDGSVASRLLMGSRFRFVEVVDRLKKRTLKAKRLVIQWQASQARIRKLKEKLRRERTKADGFEKEISRLKG